MQEINHEYYVSLEIAKLLKEAGFDWPCSHAICCDSTHYPNLKEGDILEYNYLECSELIEEKKPHMLLCPTLDIAQRWLREVKGIYICVKANAAFINCKYFVTVNISDTKWGNVQDENKKTILYDTYEEAQEEGIKKVLEIILEKKQ